VASSFGPCGILLPIHALAARRLKIRAMSTLEDQLAAAAATDAWAAKLSSVIDEQRQRAKRLLADQKERFGALEGKVAARLDELIAGIERDRAGDDVRQKELNEQAARLAESESRLAGRQQEIESRLEEFDQLRQAAAAERQGQGAEVVERQEELARQLGALHDERALLESQIAEIADGRRKLKKLQSQIDASRDEQAARQKQLADEDERLKLYRKELDAHRGQLEEIERQVQADQAAIAANRRAAESEARRHEEERDRLRQEAARLDSVREELARRQADTNSQRRRIAKELRAQRDEQLAEIERRRAEIERVAITEDTHLRAQLAELAAESSRFRGEAESLARHRDETLERLKARDEEFARLERELRQSGTDLQTRLAASEKSLAETRDEVAALRAERDEAASQSAARAAELQARAAEAAELRARVESLQAVAAKGESAGRADSAELARLREEYAALVRRLAEAETKAGGSPPETKQEIEELRRRFELAVDDVRDLKRRNAELEEKLATARAAPRPAAAAIPGERLDWEAQKLKMLAQLESDFDEDDPEESADRLTVESTVRITDQVVAEKDAEIAELKKLLDEQSQSVGSFAVGAAAVAELLDRDELIGQERENLKRLQAEWQEKLRKSEIDISVERARLARHRAELEEKARAMEEERKKLDAERPVAGAPAKAKSTAGRWLARLGLAGSDEEEKT
jgi:chromosome segregation ATPase